MSKPPKTAQAIILAPVVSPDPNSKISNLARDAATVQAQSHADSVYDTKCEAGKGGCTPSSYTGNSTESFLASMDEYSQTNTTPLLLLNIGLICILVYGIGRRSRK